MQQLAITQTTRLVKKWSARDAKKCIIVPSDLDHKYSRGVIGIITGSAQFPGAAVLSTSAAAAIGAAAAITRKTTLRVVRDGPVPAGL